jgi:hypothetical protein
LSSSWRRELEKGREGKRREEENVLELEKRAGEGGVTPVDHESGRWW